MPIDKIILEHEWQDALVEAVDRDTLGFEIGKQARGLGWTGDAPIGQAGERLADTDHLAIDHRLHFLHGVGVDP